MAVGEIAALPDWTGQKIGNFAIAKTFSALIAETSVSVKVLEYLLLYLFSLFS
jgi:hypothetical protein